MRAAILTAIKKPLQIKDISIPSKLHYGQVLVKIFFSGVCGSQISEIDGLRGKDKNIPHLLGHEGSGKVIKVGPGVSNVKKGDLVVLHYMRNEGIESQTPKYYWNKKTINAGGVTTFNEMAIVSENRLTRLSKNFDKRTAALFGCAITTGFGVINNDSNLKLGQSVIILGLGGIGLSVCQSAALKSANPIIGIDKHKVKINLAKKLGLTHGFSKREKLEKKIYKLLQSDGADIVVEATGKKEMIELAYKLTKKKGETILCGQPKRSDLIKFPILPENHGKKIKISLGGSANPKEDINNYIRLFKDKKINIKKLITHEFPLNDINKAIKLLRSGKAGRILIRM